MEAIYSVLYERNEDFIKNLSEIEDRISQEETEKSLFAANMKRILHGICYLTWGILALFFVATVYLCFAKSVLFENPVGVLVLFSVC